jgi:dephospho-CoA kinase
MLKIALTGGMGSGKSTVAQLLRAAGMPLIDADELARVVVQPGQSAWKALRREFGPEFFREDGTLDRQKLAKRVFSQPADLKRLNKLVHPWITREMHSRLRQLEYQDEPMVIVEVPLLFELELQSGYDRVIVVYLDRQTQISRLQARDHRDQEEIEAMVRSQLPMENKLHQGNYSIDNRGTRQETQKQVENLIKDLKNLLDKRA